MPKAAEVMNVMLNGPSRAASSSSDTFTSRPSAPNVQPYGNQDRPTVPAAGGFTAPRTFLAPSAPPPRPILPHKSGRRWARRPAFPPHKPHNLQDSSAKKKTVRVTKTRKIVEYRTMVPALTRPNGSSPRKRARATTMTSLWCHASLCLVHDDMRHLPLCHQIIDFISLCVWQESLPTESGPQFGFAVDRPLLQQVWAGGRCQDYPLQ